VGFLLCLGLAVGALLAWDASYEGRVLSGVQVGGVDLSGLDRTGASAALAGAFEGYSDGRVVLGTSAGEVTVSYGAFSRHADIDAMVDAALGTGRVGSPIDRAVAEVRLALSPTSLEPLVALDEHALAARIAGAVARLDREPADARIRIEGGQIITTPAQPGRRYDAAAAAAAAIEAVSRVDAPPEVAVAVGVTQIAPEHGDDEVLAAKAAADRMTGDIIVTYGDEDWSIRAPRIRSWLRFETTDDGTVWPTVDEAAIAASFKKITADVKRDPVSARYLKTRGGRIVGVIAASNGRRLDAAGTAAAIADELVTRSRGAAPAPVEIAVAKVEPKLTTAEALKHGPQMVRLGTWKTWFPISASNYWGANIWRPAEVIDGTVLMPGQRFEWWSALGPVSSATGYGPGGFIAGNHTEPTGALGGGMCSSSTTLFNAALRAGLQMGARDNHRYYISRYPLGLDATVSKTRSGGGQTLTFTNDMANPIVIRTFRYRAGGRGWVQYEIWGVSDGRKVSLTRPAVSNVRKATTQVVYVSTLRKGVREQKEYPANGMDVSVTRVVRSRGGGVLHRDTYRTRYALWNGVVHIGR
ncbi:MAG: VanW family protein, partial [Candidatus Limnocylindrales bacterium]